MNTKKRLTPKERELRDEKQRIRMRIANLVARKPEIENICCICGNKGTILHNYKDPYKIAFICEDCRKDPQKLEEAENYRIDIRTEMNKNCLNIKHFTLKEIKAIVKGYVSQGNSPVLPIGEYCNKFSISRYQFNLMVDIYIQNTGDEKIKEDIKRRSDFIRRRRVEEAKRVY